MTKEEFENYNGLLHCMTCNHDVPKIHMYYKKVYKNGDIIRCNVCEWIKRHKGLPEIEGFNSNEIIMALYFFIYEESKIINNLSNKINRTLDDTIDLFQALKIGNKKCVVKTNCEYCGKETFNPPNVYKLHKNLYCSSECYWNDKPNKIESGKDSQFYNRIETFCTNCSKKINVILYDYNKKNSFGDNHNFCSQECYWEYRSKYYIGDKCAMTGRELTEEQKEKLRLIVLNNSRNSKRFNSKIQLKVNEFLNNNNIDYEREYTIKYYAVDNYLTNYNLIIEVMGDYWHTNPLRYNENKYQINEVQQKGLLHDKQKHTYIKAYNNIEILYLWETDINDRPDVCESLILKYIKNNGILDNYHSFNWEFKNNILCLRNELIVPYQDMSSDKYKHLIKKKVG